MAILGETFRLLMPFIAVTTVVITLCFLALFIWLAYGAAAGVSFLGIISIASIIYDLNRLRGGSNTNSSPD